MGRLAVEAPCGKMGGARVEQGSLGLLLPLKSASDRLSIPEPCSSLLRSVTGKPGDTEAVTCELTLLGSLLGMPGFRSQSSGDNPRGLEGFPLCVSTEVSCSLSVQSCV